MVDRMMEMNLSKSVHRMILHLIQALTVREDLSDLIQDRFR